jgi:hypothetical protein
MPGTTGRMCCTVSARALNILRGASKGSAQLFLSESFPKSSAGRVELRDKEIARRRACFGESASHHPVHIRPGPASAITVILRLRSLCRPYLLLDNHFAFIRNNLIHAIKASRIRTNSGAYLKCLVAKTPNVDRMRERSRRRGAAVGALTARSLARAPRERTACCGR